MKKLFTILLIFTFGGFLSAQELDHKESYDILFLGNSLFAYNDLPNMFQILADSAQRNVNVDSYLKGGMSLFDQTTNENVFEKINARDWDFVVLIGSSASVAYPSTFSDDPVFSALQSLQKTISDNNSATKMVVCMPWAYEDGMTWYGWPDTYQMMQRSVYENSIEYANDLDYTIAPAGWAWLNALQDLNHPLHYLHMPDWSHPRYRGSYLTACVIYSTLFKQSTIGNTFVSGIENEEMATYFQTIATNTVIDSLSLWNITSINNSHLKPNPIDYFYLHSISPNPSKSFTTINYEIYKPMDIEISLFNLLGEKIEILVNEKKNRGSYQQEINVGELNGGCYYIQMNNGIVSRSRKVIIVD